MKTQALKQPGVWGANPLHLQPKCARVVLPYPPSYNRYWRNGFVSTEGQLFKRRAAVALLGYNGPCYDGEVVVELRFYRPRKSGDVDNRVKQVLDALQGVCYNNDNQVQQFTAARFDDAQNPRVEIVVEPK